MNVGNDISVHFQNLLILEDFFRPLITQLDTIGVVCDSANNHDECAENDNARKERGERIQGNTRAVNPLLTEAEVVPKVKFMMGKFGKTKGDSKGRIVHSLLGNPSKHS